MEAEYDFSQGKPGAIVPVTSVQRFKNMPQTTRFPIKTKTLHQIKRY